MARNATNLVLPKKVGLVLVHPQLRSEDVARMENPRDVHDRLLRRKFDSICTLAECANQEGVPAYILILTSNPDGIPKKLTDKAGENAMLLRGDSVDGFCETGLRDMLNAAGVKTPVIAGFHRQACAYLTAKSGVAWGYTVVTSWGVLMGGKGDLADIKDSETSDEWKRRSAQEAKKAIKFYEKKTILLPTLDDLIALFRNGKN